FDTSNPPGRERDCLEFVGELLQHAGVESRFLARDPERPNLLARIPGRGEAPPLLLYGHVDVVPAEGEEWRHPPFSGDVIDGDVWGRGALDMKSGVAILIAAVLRAAAGEKSPAGDLVLALTCDEEAGSEHGAKFLVDEHAEEFADVRHAISEFGGTTEWVAGRPFYPIQLAEKQACTIRAVIRGAGGHASTRVRDTAAGKLGRLLTLLERKRLPVHVTPVAREMLTAMAAALPLHQRLALRPLLAPPLTDRVLSIMGTEGRSLDPILHNTATATIVHGGEQINVIPTRIVVELDGRVVPGQTTADLVHELDALAPGLAEYEIVREEPAAPAEPDMTLFPMLASIISDRHPGATPFPLLLPGYTDARYFSRLGIQTYGFLPLRVAREFPRGLIHAPNERVPAEAVRFGADCVTDAVQRYLP
ncbi:MAG: M20/M25/M40 family metallo-hydrolase, partial [Gaiellaceae bacterium]